MNCLTSCWTRRGPRSHSIRLYVACRPARVIVSIRLHLKFNSTEADGNG
jgi:hypothetical protein